MRLISTGKADNTETHTENDFIAKIYKKIDWLFLDLCISYGSIRFLLREHKIRKKNSPMVYSNRNHYL